MTTNVQKQPTTSVALPHIRESSVDGLLVLSSTIVPSDRKILFINSYGGPGLWRKVASGLAPGHHLWGIPELVAQGYEVAITEPLQHLRLLSRHVYPHDLKWFHFIRNWLGPEDIILCGHTLLYWIPLLRASGIVRCHIVSLCYAREELDFGRAHSGIIAMTPAAVDQVRRKSPRTKVAHLGWGCDLAFFLNKPYAPKTFLSCGITNRDFTTLKAAAALCAQPIRVVHPGVSDTTDWPSNVELVDGGRGWNTDEKRISFVELLNGLYKDSSAVLVIINEDEAEYTANGFTNLLEAMAMARPVIMTRTGAVPAEIDIEKEGCGIFVPPNDPKALAIAIDYLAAHPREAEVMGQRGRLLAERHYNIQRFSRDLHAFLSSL